MHTLPAGATSRASGLVSHTLTVATVIYLLILPFTSSAALRNVALGIAVACAASILYRDRAKLPAVPRPLAYALLFWALWCAASWFWSLNPTYTANELRHEIIRPALVFGVFFIAAEHRMFRLWTWTLMCGIVLLSAVAAWQLVRFGVWNPDRFHGGVGPYSTWVVMVFPLSLALLLPRSSLLFDLGKAKWPLSLLFVALIMANAYLTMNRIVWFAFSVTILVFFLIYIFAPWGFVRERVNVVAVGISLMVAQSVAFGVVALEKTHIPSTAAPSVHESIAEDARIRLWPYVIKRIGDAPIIGHGFGRGILLTDLHNNFNDSTLWHGHNILLNSMLETGAIGFAAMLAILGALVWRYFTYLRTSQMEVAAFGIVGLAFLAGFLAKNMTDDFMVRHTGQLFWALNGILIGLGERMLHRQTPAAVSEYSR
ncbi:MAG: O-antigen ligase family protein [Casimicrobiaceae bacterium]